MAAENADNTVANLAHKVNEYLTKRPLPGKLISIESLQFRGIPENFDTDTTTWEPKTSFFLSQQDFMSAFRIWFRRGEPQYETIGFADFFPAVLKPGGWLEKAQVELLPSLMTNVDRWVSPLFAWLIDWLI